jgi:phage tail sheath protein FI
MYFPRISTLDRLRGRPETFAGCGAVAGMLARLDAASPPWSPAEHDEVLLRPGLRPAATVSEAERARLLHAGINTLSALRVAWREACAARTLATGNSISTDWRYLAARRTAQFVALSVRQGTAWMALAGNGPETWRRAREQVEAFLATLDAEGAFAARHGEGYFVICDERLNGPDARAEGRIRLVFGFAASRPSEYHSFVVTHRGERSDVRAVSVNRYTTSGRLVAEEIEASLLRGLSPQ